MLSYAGAMLLAGVLGSFGHCAGMCGPLVIMVGLRLPERGARSLALFGQYHIARIAVYALLGALAGAATELLGLGLALHDTAGWISLALGAAVIYLGVSYATGGRVGLPAASTAWVGRSIGRVLRSGSTRSRWTVMLALGALNGLLPCGLVYASLLIAAGSGSAATAAFGMFFFGLGTVPVLLVLSAGASAVTIRTRARLMHVAGAFIAVVGVQLVLRGLAGLGYLDHVMVGRVMLW